VAKFDIKHVLPFMFFFGPLYCLFFELWVLNKTPLVSSNCSYILLKGEAHNDNPCKKKPTQTTIKYLDNLFKNTFIILTIGEN
jgi:hypothetical protein